MGDSPQTRLSLLVRLRDSQDDRASAAFVETYAPLIHGFACKQGLQDADAADLTQEVLRAVARNIHRLDYDPERGLAAANLPQIHRCRGSGGVRCKLEVGPEGMTVSPEGLLRWQVPTGQEGKRENVIVTIREASGKEIQHSFAIMVE